MNVDRNALRRIADLHAVYRMFDEDGRLLYVGLTGGMAARLGGHAEKRWFPQVATIKLEWFPTRAVAALAEQCAIRDERPRMNIVGTRQHLYQRKQRRQQAAIRPPSDLPELTVREAVEEGIFGGTSTLERARKRVQRAGLEPSGRRSDGSLTYARADLHKAAGRKEMAA